MKSLLFVTAFLAGSLTMLVAQEPPVRSEVVAIKRVKMEAKPATNSTSVKTPEVAPLTPAVEHVVSGSVTMRRLPPDTYAVLWTYTEAGATNAIAAWEKNPDYQRFVSAKHRAGWLKRPTSKVFFKTEAAANEFYKRLNGL